MAMLYYYFETISRLFSCFPFYLILLMSQITYRIIYYSSGKIKVSFQTRDFNNTYHYVYCYQWRDFQNEVYRIILSCIYASV